MAEIRAHVAKISRKNRLALTPQELIGNGQPKFHGVVFSPLLDIKLFFSGRQSLTLSECK